MGTRVKLNPAELKRQEFARKLEMSTAEIGLSVRTTNCLDEQGISTVEDLLRCRRADLLAIANFGEKTLEEVYLALSRLGFYRRDRRPGEQANEQADEQANDSGPSPDEETEESSDRE